MKRLPLLSALLAWLLFPGPMRAADPFYEDLSKRLSEQGLPTFNPMNGYSEDAVMASFRLAQNSGHASKRVVSFAELPFKKGLYVESQSLPDHLWQLFAQEPIPGPWAQGDNGLLVLSIHAAEAEPASLEVTLKGSEDPHPAFLDVQLSPTARWTTVYLPFTVPADMSRANLRFLFGTKLQSFEIGGIAVFNFGSGVTLDDLAAAVAKLPTDLGSTANGESIVDSQGR